MGQWGQDRVGAGPGGGVWCDRRAEQGVGYGVRTGGRTRGSISNVLQLRGSRAC